MPLSRRVAPSFGVMYAGDGRHGISRQLADARNKWVQLKYNDVQVYDNALNRSLTI